MYRTKIFIFSESWNISKNFILAKDYAQKWLIFIKKVIIIVTNKHFS